jgi:hypothetical protein
VCIAAAALFACRGILGIEEGTDDAGREAGSNTPDASASSDSAASTLADGATSPNDASAAKETGQPLVDGATSSPLDWAEWPMPGTSPGAANYLATADTVTDKTTGLMWERGFSAKVMYANAPAHCITLTAGGFSDWRMPTWIELVSLVDYGRSNPAIDVSTFPSTPNDFFWSGTINARTQLPLAVFFFSGAVSSIPTNSSQLWRVRCVRMP